MSIHLDEVNQTLSSASPQQVLQWAFETFGNDIQLATSLGAEDMVLLHMAKEISSQSELDLRVFTLDTGRLHEETQQLLMRSRDKYKVNIQTYFPNAEKAQELVSLKGPLSFFMSVEARKECCFVRKVEPLRRALANSQSWITGLRADQNTTRTEAAHVEIDVANSKALGRTLYKVNPLLHWTEQDVWQFVDDNNVPTNALHKKGFPSIGCAPCTRAIEPGENVRAGRWWWEDPENKECGLHA